MPGSAFHKYVELHIMLHATCKPLSHKEELRARPARLWRRQLGARAAAGGRRVRQLGDLRGGQAAPGALMTPAQGLRRARLLPHDLLHSMQCIRTSS